MLRWGIVCLLMTLAFAVSILPGTGQLSLAWAWFLPPLPKIPVPRLAILRQPREPIYAELVERGPSTGLLSLPAHVSGRVAAGSEPGGFQHQWPGIYAEARFRGKAVTVRFDDAINRARITLDGGAGGIVEVSRPGAADLRISGLTPAPHDIRMDKISESFSPASFGGFLIAPDAEAMPPPAPRPRLVEFIGDSDTVGYGATAQRRDCSADQVFAATDSTQTFASRVAAYFQADYRILARSGIKLMRHDGDPEPQMVERYGRALPDEADSTPAPEPAADIIVIALGPNDVASNAPAHLAGRERRRLSLEFQQGLADFVRAREERNPRALFVLLAFSEYGNDLIDAHRAAEKALREGGARITLVVLPWRHRRGCHWHPSPGDHAMTADRLIAAIAAAERDQAK